MARTSGYFLGIDGGTEGLRVGLFDKKGHKITEASSSYKTFFPRSGWAEQDSRSWESALLQVVKTVIGKEGIRARDIMGIGVDATISTLIPMSKEGKALSNAILWMDIRAKEQFEKIKKTGHPLLNKGPTVEWTPCKILWIKENLPQIYAQTHRLIEHLDWLIYKLTGEYTLSLCNLSARWFYDKDKGGFPEDFYSEFGLADLFNKLPERILGPGEIVGGLKKEIAGELGLVAGIPVVEGAPDGLAASIGTNALKAGELMMIMGSSHCHLTPVQEEIHIPGIMGSFPDCPIQGMHLLEAGQVSTGSILNWYKGLLTIWNEEKIDGKDFYALMNEQAARVPVGSEGLILLDYWQGNRNPHQDPLCRGVIWGLSLKHRPEHLYRAIMEGVAYGTRLILDTLQKEEIEIKRIIACGGGAKSNLWLQIHSDVAGLPIEIPEEKEASMLGGAIAASVGVGVYSNLLEASAKMVKVKKAILPNLENYKEYSRFYSLYKDTYSSMKNLLHKGVGVSV